jgi:multiple sugar transport system substrate-binding protein
MWRISIKLAVSFNSHFIDFAFRIKEVNLKKLSIVLSLIVVLGMLLTACQPAPAPTEAPKEEAKPTEAPKEEVKPAEAPKEEVKPAEAPKEEAKPADSSAKPLAGKTLKFLTIQPHNVAAQNLQKWFEEDTGAKVELIVVPYDNVVEKAVLDSTSGANEIDVIDYWYPGLGTLVENNVLENLDQWYKDNADFLKTDDFFPVYFDAFSLEKGSRWGIPYDGDMHLLWYYKDIFDKYKLTPPATWDEYLKDCKTITEGEKGAAYGCAIMAKKVPLIIIGSYLNRLGAYGGAFFDDTGKPTINSPEAVAALKDMIEQGKYALPSPSATAFDEALGGWYTGKVGMVEFWTDMPGMTDDPKSSQIVGKWGVVPLPKGPGDKGKNVASVNAGFGIGVSANSKNKDVAMAFLKYIADPKTAIRYNTVVGGIDPVRKSTLTNPDYIKFASQVVVDAITKAHENAVVWPHSAQWFKLQEPLTDNLSLALAGQKDPKQALDDTQKAWEDILKK